MDATNGELKSTIHGFLMAKEAAGMSNATLKFYRENLNRISWWFHTFRPVNYIYEIIPDYIRELLVYVRTSANRWGTGSTSSRKPASMSTVDAYWRTIQSLFSWLVNEEILDPKLNPMAKIPRPVVDRKIVEDIPLPLVKKALENCGRSPFTLARNRAIILTFFDTGARLTACSTMTLKNTSVETGLAIVREKGNKQVTVRLGKTAVAVLKEYLKLREQFTSDLLWLKENGKPFSRLGIQSMIRRLARFGGGARWTPHTFRNTWAINFLRNGGDTFSLQVLGGWTDLEMPRRYTQALKIEDAINVHKRVSPADRLEGSTNDT